jgi:hypothetical protein
VAVTGLRGVLGQLEADAAAQASTGQRRLFHRA